MEQWENILDKITREPNPDILEKQFAINDNFTLLLTATPSQIQSLEVMLERYSKAENFDENYDMFKMKRYMFNDICIVQYASHRMMLYVDAFEQKTGIKSDSNAFISFHPKDGPREKQTFSIRDAVVEISKKVMELGTHFVTETPLSEYNPKSIIKIET